MYLSACVFTGDDLSLDDAVAKFGDNQSCFVAHSFRDVQVSEMHDDGVLLELQILWREVGDVDRVQVCWFSTAFIVAQSWHL